MSNSRNSEPVSGISLGDIYFVLFRHKWRILILAVIGLLAAAVYYKMRQPPYQSEAKLFIRYISDTRSQNPNDNGSRVTSSTDYGQGLMNSEMEILTSFDLAAQVATNIGPEKILANYGGGHDATRAAGVLLSNLKVAYDGSIVHILYSSVDPALLQPVLNEVIREYLGKHAQVHQAMGISDDLMTEQMAQLQSRISQTDNELWMAKTNAGIIDIADSQKSYSEESTRIRRELLQAEAELAGRQAAPAPAPLSTNLTAATTNLTAPPNVPAAEVAKYEIACSRLTFLQKKAEDFILQQGYTEENKLVKEVRLQITEAEKVKLDVEKSNPRLLDQPQMISANGSTPQSITASVDATRLALLPVRIKILQQQLAGIQADAAKLEEAQAKIADLERKKLVQEGSYKFFANSMEEARINEALGPGRISNINQIQQPSPPFKDLAKFYKKIAMLIFGGIGLGIGWAFLIELYLDRSIKRAVEVETKLHLPCFLSIPDLHHSGRALKAESKRRLLGFCSQSANPNDSGSTEQVPTIKLDAGAWQINHSLDTHYDALRDRLVLYFESINLTRKPKLVAITSTNRGAGVSTIAAGLAASLSETGDGRVLLVDMNQENGAAQQFFDGKPSCQLDDALISEKRDGAMVQDNLYVVTENSNSDKLSRVLPKRFATLVPKLKASDYDYIIFDMPPVTQTSVTTRLASFMDTVMLVVESEKSECEAVLQANALLAKSKANVCAILNKTRNYVPNRLVHDINSKL